MHMFPKHKDILQVLALYYNNFVFEGDYVGI
jgi:hypothetical protein